MSCVAALKESLRLDKCSGFRNNRSRRRAFRQLFADPPTAPLPTQRCRDHSIFLTTWRPLADSSLRTPWYHPGVRVCVVITKPGVYVLISRVTDPVNLELSCP